MSASACAGDVNYDDGNSGRTWRRSSRSYGGGNCVEVATQFGARVAIRDSKNRQGAVLGFTPAQWNDFIAGVRSGALGL